MTDHHKHIAIVCGTCGSDDVTRDANSEWSVDTQRWELRAVFDSAYCNRCDAERRLVEIELERIA